MHIGIADGRSLPPLYVFKGKTTNKNLLYGAPAGTESHVVTCYAMSYMRILTRSMQCAGSRFAMQESGYFTSNIFSDTIRHIIDYQPNGQKLLIVDGHDSHTDVDALDM